MRVVSVMLRNAIRLHRCNCASGLNVSYWRGSHCFTPRIRERSQHMPAPTKRRAEGRQLDRVDRKTEAQGSGIRGANRGQSTPQHLGGEDKEASRVKRKRTAIVKLLRQTILPPGEDCNTSLITVNSSKHTLTPFAFMYCSSARAHKNGPLEYSSRPFVCALSSVTDCTPSYMYTARLTLRMRTSCLWQLRRESSET